MFRLPPFPRNQASRRCVDHEKYEFQGRPHLRHAALHEGWMLPQMGFDLSATTGTLRVF